ncbi:glycine cleavage system protein GcvH [Glacieibacterium frigidum]|uniref:Glycine cleavage system H protein n=1 Tax=Glacieibacterium frigidum TaxID=2593303 RepID=A0A552UJ68_9SPHN|nr:glycine cleavage system protein GcvH [Glacieibacterium frigidum]TRW18289.1 glycine cleavage system protein GcvH [Glacieibacterium frigidum]
MTRYFTKEHEWVDVEGDTGTCGITSYAQEMLGDVVFVDLPAPGRVLTKGGDAAVVESVKAASDVYAPVGGTVIEVNADLEADPALVNTGAETGGWFFKLTLSDASELDGLMDEDAYKAFVATL